MFHYLKIIADLTRNVFGFEHVCTIWNLDTGPLCTSECTGECHFSANLCKRALHVTADVILEATHNADMLTINVRTINKMLKAT